MILASASPRRAAILEGLGISFDVHPARIHESILEGESPEEHALRLSTQKALAVAHLHSGEWVLGGDTLVTIDGGILGKPRDPKHAVEMLLSLQGRTHQVVSALALVVPSLAVAESFREFSGQIDKIKKRKLIVDNRKGDKVSFVQIDTTEVSGEKTDWKKLKKKDWVTVSWKFSDKPRKAYKVVVLPPRDEAGEDL